MSQQPLRILFLTPQLPFPPRQGTSIRNYNLIRFLSERHEIDLVTFLAPGDELTHDSPLRTHCRRITTIGQPVRTTSDRVRTTLLSFKPDMGLRLNSDEMMAKMRSLPLTGYDIVQVEGIEMAPYAFAIRKRLKSQRTRTGIVFDDHNCEYLLQKRNALTDLRNPRRWLAAAYSIVQWNKLRHYERRVCVQTDLILAVSEPDRQALKDLASDVDVRLIPNGIDTASYSSLLVDVDAAEAPNIVFTGKMDYRPNVDAVVWFGTQVFPRIRRQIPKAQFQIVGQQPLERVFALSEAPGIQITGEVPEIEPYLQQASVYIIPMRIGGGTRLKALQAMATGLPIVATSLGVEGIAVQDGRELLIRDEPREFAGAVLDLINDHQGSGSIVNRLGSNAKEFVAKHYDWQTIIPHLEQAYFELVEAKQEKWHDKENG